VIYYDEAERRKILEIYYNALDELDNWYLDNQEDEVSAEEMDKFDSVTRKMNEASSKYLRMTPKVPMSRCPFSGMVSYHSIDHYGIDGPWWNYTKPLRPVEDLPVTFFAITGSMLLGGVPEKTGHQVRPGPEKPYIVKQILERPGFRAVISKIMVGNHVAYPVFYYSEDVEPVSEVTRNWGTYLWMRRDRNGRYGYLEPDERGLEYDFDLSKWVEQGKLLWILPGDTSMTLRNGVSGCPYLNIGGAEKFQIIIDGEVTHEEEEEEW